MYVNSCKFEKMINKIYYMYFYYKWRSFGIVFLVFMCLSVKYLDFRINRFLLFRYLRRILMVDLFWFFVLARDIVVIVLMLEFLFFRRFFKELMIDVFWYLFEKKVSICISRYILICLLLKFECILNCIIDKLRKLYLRKLM